MAALQCHISGGLLPPKLEGRAVQFGRVHCDTDHNVWMVDVSKRDVFYFNQQEIAHRQKEFELQLGCSRTSPGAKPIYSCKKTDEAVLAVLFTTIDSFRLTHVLTTKGALSVFYTKEEEEEDSGASPALLQEWQLAAEVTSVVVAHSSASTNEVQLFAGCFDGVYGEVILVSLSFEVQKATTATLCGSLDARGVFRIKGRLSQLLLQTDGVASLLLSVSQDGNIDVWDWGLEQDVTPHYGGISWDVAAHGAPCDGGALLHDGKLWVPTDKGTIIVLPFIRDQTAAKALLLDAHRGLVRQLVLMSGGRHIWSYAEGGRVSVWDTDSVSFKGSFLFPDCRIADLACADVELVTQLWAVDSETGGLASLVVNESMQNFKGKLFLSEAAVRQAREDRSTVEQLDAVLDGVSREFVQAPWNHLPSSAVPYQGRDDAVRRVESLVEVAQDYAASAALLRSFFHDETVTDGGAKTQMDHDNMETMLTCLIADCKRAALVDDDVQHFCSSVCALMEDARDLTTLEDVLEALSDWKEDILQNQKAKEESEDMEGDDAMPFKDVIAEMEKELREKDLYTSELDKRIVELLNEQRELSLQLERAQQGLSDRDQQIAVLQRTADAAKKAAELASTDTAHLFELESCLHSAREREKELEADLKHLRAREEMFQQSEEEAAEIEQKLSSYEAKEKLAAHAIEDFISVQNSLFEEVTALVDWVASTDVEEESSAAALANRSHDLLVDECRDKLILLETHFAEKVSQQKKYFSLLRSEYVTAVA